MRKASAVTFLVLLVSGLSISANAANSLPSAGPIVDSGFQASTLSSEPQGLLPVTAGVVAGQCDGYTVYMFSSSSGWNFVELAKDSSVVRAERDQTNPDGGVYHVSLPNGEGTLMLTTGIGMSDDGPAPTISGQYTAGQNLGSLAHCQSE